MSDQGEKWRFYGRENEVESLTRHLRAGPGFDASRIHGRRGIGKTELMAEVARRCDLRPPVLIFELLARDRESGQDLNERFIREAKESLPRDLLEGFPAPDNKWSGLHPSRFTEILLDLFRRGVTVALDEFHFAAEQCLEGALKQMIDRLQRTSAESVDGRLFVMGSHQQQILCMFAPDQPLYQRIYPAAMLKQWEAPTVLEMADEQGFLEYPGRFLTLWTAFGGVPRNWREFIRRPDTKALADMDAWESDTEWRRAFLEAYEKLLEPGSDERTDTKAFIELAPPQRDMLQWLAENHPNCVRWDRLADAMRGMNHDDAEEPFYILRRYLDLVESYGAFWTEDKPRVRIVDNATLFQRAVYPDFFAHGDRIQGPAVKEAVKDMANRRLNRLATIEGAALERLAVSHFSAREDVSLALARPWQPVPGSRSGAVEVDVIALNGHIGQPDARFVMCGCKRNADRHDYKDLEGGFRAFKDAVMASDRDAEWPDGGVEKVVVSPSFTEKQRERATAQGFRVLDIAAMALLSP